MAVLAQLEKQERRQSSRRTLRLEVPGSAESMPTGNVIIHDVSVTGMLIETSFAIDVGEDLHVAIPEAGVTPAKVVWASGGRFFGCEFCTPISKSALSGSLLRGAAAARQPVSIHSSADAYLADKDVEQWSNSEDKLPVGRRLAILFTLAAGLWMLIAWAAGLI